MMNSIMPVFMDVNLHSHSHLVVNVVFEERTRVIYTRKESSAAGRMSLNAVEMFRVLE